MSISLADLHIISSLFDAIFAYLIVKSVANNKPHIGYKLLFASVYISAVLFSNWVNPSLNPRIAGCTAQMDSGTYSILRLLFYAIVLFALSSICFRAKIVARLFASMLYVAVIEVGEIFAYGVVHLAFPNYIHRISPNINLIFLVGFFSVYTYYTIILIIMRYFPARSIDSLSIWQSFTLISMPTLCSIVIAILVAHLKYCFEAQYGLHLILSLFFMLLLFFIVMFFKSIIESQEQAKAKAVLSSQIELHIAQYEALESANDALRSFKHDWKNHMLVIHDSLMANDIGGLLSYIESFEDIAPAFLPAYVYTNNTAIDALLSHLARKSKEHNIELSISAKVPPKIHVLTADICVLISNALDNAYEACLKIDGAPRWIKVHLSHKTGFLFFSVKNSNKAAVLKQYGQIVSSKDVPELHGIGIKNMTAIAEKYNGQISCSFDAQAFFVKVMLRNAV